MRWLFLTIYLFITSTGLYSQTSGELHPTAVKSLENITDGVSLKCDKGTIVISFFSTSIIHFTYYPNNSTTAHNNTFIKPSRTIVNPKVTDNKNVIKIKSVEAEVRINKTNCVIEYADSKGNIFLTGNSLTATPIPEKNNTYHVNLVFAAPKDENYYGLGQLPGEWLNHRGFTVNVTKKDPVEERLINGIPFMVCNKRYGICLPDLTRTTVSPGVENKTEWDAESNDEISYFVILGNTMEGIYSGYLSLTGAAPLPPRSLFGYIYGRQRFKNQNEVLKIARKYRDKKYPCDNLLIDRQTWKMAGDMDWDPKLWPNLKKMNSELAENHFNSLITCETTFAKESKNFSIADKNRFLVKQTNNATSKDNPSSLINFSNINALQWYWNLIKENYAEKGFNNWKLNLSGSEITNEQAKLLVREMFEGHRNSLSKRCLLFSEKIMPGSQAYGTAFCNFTTEPNWDTYKRQIAEGINLNASGFLFWGTNIGGYSPIKGDKQDNQSIARLLVGCDTCMASTKKMKDYIELYVRWFQFGAFCPIFVSQGAREQNEIWSFGGEAEKILAKYLKIRYKLLSYIYSQAYQTHQTGIPIMRGLFIDYPADTKAASITDEYLFGPSFLISPVTEQGKEARDIYLPAGSDWFDYWSYKKVKGGETSNFSAPIDKMPIFIKAGSIVPFDAETQYSGEKPAGPVEIRVYPGTDAKFEFYEDENDNYNYENGQYSIIPFFWNEKKQTLTIGDRKGEFNGMVQERTFTILFGADYTKAPETITYSGKQLLIKMK
jgi:alpha-glucosidase (family GH31 glycosyl hydrolase)